MGKYYIGWDVGAWHCKEKSKEDKSQDAIAILDEGRNLIKGIWEGNLKDHILKAVKEVEPKNRVEYFLTTLFGEKITDKKIGFYSENEFFIAIDTPLGWTKAFRELLIMWSDNKNDHVLNLGEMGSKNNNPLLTRQTEERFDNPLSVIQDQIGSQSTKAMYLLSSFKPNRISTGVWKTTSPNLTIIETYPAPCMRSLDFIEHMKGIKPDEIQISSSDKFDALVCANLAWCFKNLPPESSPTENSNCVQFDSPPEELDPAEGWIFAPTTFLDTEFGISYPKLIGTNGLKELLPEIQIAIVLSAMEAANEKKKKREEELKKAEAKEEKAKNKGENVKKPKTKKSKSDEDEKKEKQFFNQLEVINKWVSSNNKNLFANLSANDFLKIFEILQPSWFKKGEKEQEGKKEKKEGRYFSEKNREVFRTFLKTTITRLQQGNQ